MQCPTNFSYQRAGSSRQVAALKFEIAKPNYQKWLFLSRSYVAKITALAGMARTKVIPKPRYKLRRPPGFDNNSTPTEKNPVSVPRFIA